MWLDDFEIIVLIYFMIGLFATGLTMLLGYAWIIFEKKKDVDYNSKGSERIYKRISHRYNNTNNVLDKRVHNNVRNTLSNSKSKGQELGYNPWQE